MKEVKRKRQPLTITVNPQVVKDAKALGLNLSVVAERAYREAISRLKGEKHAK
jgi:post-segregation antitoxin (ccd killing protein)